MFFDSIHLLSIKNRILDWAITSLPIVNMAEVQQVEQQVLQIVDEAPIREDVEAGEKQVDPPAVAQDAENGIVVAEQTNNNGELVLERLHFDLEDIPVEKDKFKWELPTELASYFAKYTKKYYADGDLAAWMEQYPTPLNVDSLHCFIYRPIGLIIELDSSINQQSLET